MKPIATIQIVLTDNGQININAPMDDQQQKNMSLKMLAAGINAVIDYRPPTDILVASPQILNGIALTPRR